MYSKDQYYVIDHKFYEQSISSKHYSLETLYDDLSNECESISTADTGVLSKFRAERLSGLYTGQSLKYEAYDMIKKFDSVFKELAQDTKDVKNYSDIDIIDYSCTQGIALLAYIEELEKYKLDKRRIKNIYIIDNDNDRLQRAEIHLRLYCKYTQIIIINKPYFLLNTADVCVQSCLTIHFFGNSINRLNYMPLSFLGFLKNSRYLFQYYICFDQFTKEELHDFDDMLFQACEPVFEDDGVEGCTAVVTTEQLWNWAYCAYRQENLETLEILQNSDIQMLLIPEYDLSHTKGRYSLWYEDDLIEDDEPYDTRDLQKTLYETDFNKIKNHFLIYRIVDLQENNLKQFNMIVEAYENLAKNGIYEAYNNLGVIKSMTNQYDEDTVERKLQEFEAIVLYEKAAENGSESAMRNLLSYYCANEYDNKDKINYYINKLLDVNSEIGLWEKATSLFAGIHEEKDIAQATRLYEKLLTVSNSGQFSYRNRAILNLALIEYKARGKDFLIKTLRLLEQASLPSYDILNLKAVILLQLGLYKDGIQLLHKIISETTHKYNYLAEYNLGVCFKNGIGCPVDDNLAEQHLKMAIGDESEQDYEPPIPQVFLSLANLYSTQGKNEQAALFYDKVIKYDTGKSCAAILNRCATKTESIESAKKLLENHLGCTRCNEANRYDVAAHDCPRCQFTTFLDPEIDVDDRVKNLIASANQGYAKAQCILGDLFEDDNPSESIKWYELAAEQGENDSCEKILKKRLGERQFDNETTRWAVVNAQKNNSEAQMVLSILIRKSNPKEADKWLLKSAKNGFPKAQFLLGDLSYKRGKKEYGIYYLKQSAEAGFEKAISRLQEIQKNSVGIDGKHTITYKASSEVIQDYLEKNNIKCFYHFTSVENLSSIKQSGGLYSWKSCEENGIEIPVPGGSPESREIDLSYGLEDYVRLSFCQDHPMSYRLKENGESLVLLKIDTKVAEFSDTLFSDINAADKNHHHGGTLNDLKRIDLQATKETYVSKESTIFKKHQAEVLVKTFIPIKYILNINNPIAI